MHLNRMAVEYALVRKEWTQKDLANASGFAPYTISNIIRGASCKISTAIKIADALGVERETILEQK